MSLPPILQRVVDAGHVAFDNGDYDLNIVGIRSANQVANSFDDWITITYKVDGIWQTKWYACTTDPGTYWLEGYDSSRVKGTAILQPGQYRGVYAIDKHAGAYEALCQRNGPVKCWRDSNRDNVLDWQGATFEGMYGINIHHASYTGTSTQVNKWSAGCTVIANIDDFNDFMEVCRRQVKLRGWSKFTYTLIEE